MTLSILQPKLTVSLKLPAATQAVVLPTLFDATFVPVPSLEQLALSAPLPADLTDLAAAVGCSFDLLDRVSRRRQPLPSQLAGPIAARLGLQPGEVAASAGAVVDVGATRLGPRLLSAVPPDRLLGDVLYMRPLRPTVPVVFPGT